MVLECCGAGLSNYAMKPMKPEKQPQRTANSHEPMKVACIMMQKNESLRLDAWIRYHTALFGSNCLYIFDNGSTDSAVIERLHEAIRNGSRVYWEHNQSDHYLEKGNIIANLIKDLDASDPHDFYIPLDCDEFVACEVDGKPSISLQTITSTLAAHIHSQDVLTISHKYWHNPYRRDLYKRCLPKHKSFFAQDACESLDLGFHEGRAKRSQQHTITNIVYFEFHHLCYNEYMEKCKAKLLPSLSDFSPSSLRRYTGQSYECAGELLKSEYDYAIELMSYDNFLVFPGLLTHFDDLGIHYHNLFAKCSPLGRLGLRLRRKSGQAWNRVNTLKRFIPTRLRNLGVFRQRGWRSRA